ncbi:hypothetical protein D9981_02825 [Pseudoalteromonas phenolica O-BC30]|nr:hypothetical protein D9981_02825 [Pseudoalteromonas phenolica O-BC30]
MCKALKPRNNKFVTLPLGRVSKVASNQIKVITAIPPSPKQSIQSISLAGLALPKRLTKHIAAVINDPSNSNSRV